MSSFNRMNYDPEAVRAMLDATIEALDEACVPGGAPGEDWLAPFERIWLLVAERDAAVSKAAVIEPGGARGNVSGMTTLRPLSVLGRLDALRAALADLSANLDAKSRDDVRAELEAINAQTLGVRRAITGEPQA